MSKSKNDDELEKLYKELKQIENGESKDKHELRDFFLGLLMFGAGLFMILQNAQVTSSVGYGGYFYRIGPWGVPNGLIILPVIIGIFMLIFRIGDIGLWQVFFLVIVGRGKGAANCRYQNGNYKHNRNCGVLGLFGYQLYSFADAALASGHGGGGYAYQPRVGSALGNHANKRLAVIQAQRLA